MGVQSCLRRVVLIERAFGECVILPPALFSVARRCMCKCEKLSAAFCFVYLTCLCGCEKLPPALVCSSNVRMWVRKLASGFCFH